ncbi:MAG: 1,4-alpha-glucan branching enzyme, partial [Acholeplasmataceae bacterium]|nr:1,4-alpha-glucan branching enzyme [Acholeplasmataceae bacterium]
MIHLISDHNVNEFLLGRADNLHQWMGAHLKRDNHANVISTIFTVYAPNAHEVRLVSDFNGYEGWKHV